MKIGLPSGGAGLRSQLKSRLVIVAIATLVLGIFFRVTHLDHKVYWHDEVFTSFQSAGYTTEEVDAAVFTGNLLAPAQLLCYQRLDPDHGWDATWHSLSADPVHPPYFYLLERLWMELFGSTVAVTRSLSVVFSLLTFPAMVWLCRELFDSPTAQWVAIALLAISPFQVLYAQEARQYSLWTLVVLLSSAALLRALRRQTSGSWMLYGVTVAALLNTFILSAVVLACHGLTVVLGGQWSWRSLQRYVVATGLGVLTFVPWVVVLLQNRGNLQNKTSWTTFSPPKSVLFKLWGLHFSSDFIDLGVPLEHPYSYLVPPIVLVLLGGALWLLYRHAPRRTGLLIALLMVLPAIALMLPDMMMGGQRSANTRYFVPALVGAELAAIYGITYLLDRGRSLWQYGGRVLLALVLTAGVVSCTLSWQSDTWWSKGSSYNNAAIAKFLNGLDRPILISNLANTVLGDTISLSYRLNEDARFVLVKDGVVPIVPMLGDRFLIYPSDTLLHGLQQAYGFSFEPIPQDNLPLLKLINPPP
ncbi:MAG TPA: glycosyltransferase family 39 protein [Chroococcidiopsis sp.]